MIRVGIEATALLCHHKTGIERYATSLLEALASLPRLQHSFELHLYFQLKNPYISSDQLSIYRDSMPHFHIHPYALVRGYRLFCAASTFTKNLHVFHFPQPMTLPISRCPVLITFHDASWIAMSESDAKIERVDVAKAQIDKAVNKADGIITVSNASLKDLTDAYRRLPGKIFVIYHGVDDCFRKRWSLPSDYVMLKSIDRYILAVGAIQHRKNLSRLIRALAKLNTSAVTNHALIVAGPVGHGAEEVFATANEFCRQLPVHFTGYVSQLELAKLYQGADLFVYPSLHEGFGIPLLEAMASGTVIAASRTRAAMEICGDVALYFDPYDIDDIAEKVAVALKDEPLRTRLAAAALKRSATFSWSNAARATAEAYRALASAAVLHQAGQEAE